MSHPSLEQQVTFLYTEDLATTTNFYEEVLGLPLVLDQGSCRIYQIAQSAFIGFCQNAQVQANPQGIILTLVSQDVDGWYEHLKQKGVEFEKPPAHNPTYNIYHCFLRDPNGYLLEIQTFLDPAWPIPPKLTNL